MAILPIFIPHAGCPHQCVFCNQKTISGQKSAAEDAARAQIDKWLQWIAPSVDNEAAFYGGSFTGLDAQLQEKLLQLTDRMVEKKIIGRVRLSTRPDYIDTDKLTLLKKHYVHLIELGVQSLDDKVLQAAERGHTAAQVKEASILIRQAGFKLGLQLMVGMPQQSFASLKETAAEAVDLKPDIARIYPLLVIKDTPLENLYRQGKFMPLSLEEAVEQSAYLYGYLTASRIKVIRVGLQPDEELCASGNIVAGPFHPSMGELVQSRLLQKQITAEIEMLQDAGRVIISFPVNMESKVRGLKNANVKFWQERFYPAEIVLRKYDGTSVKVSGEKENE